jgi:putative DNA methylase
MTYKKKLIEVALPLEDINREAAREKSIRHGHPSTLHLWWARRPLAACRAVLFASLVDDPSEHVAELLAVPTKRRAAEKELKGRKALWDQRKAEFTKASEAGMKPPRPGPEPTLEEIVAEQDRERLFDIIRDLVKWENSNNETVLNTARAEIMRSCGGKPPPVYDPFCGGGSIPLEAQRLGLEAHASDLNPVPVLINKLLIEIPPKFAGKPPVNPEAKRKLGASGSWKGAGGLAEDIRYYGQWMRDEAEERIGHLYPKVKLPKEHGGGEATVIAWLWARTVASPNPAAKGVHVPLIRSFWLSTKPGKKAWVEPVVNEKTMTYHFEVKSGTPNNETEIRAGTKTSRGANFRCLLTQAPLTGDHIKAEGQGGRMKSRLMSIVAETPSGRVFLAPDSHQEEVAIKCQSDWVPTQSLANDPRNIWCISYGITEMRHLFTNRQMLMLDSLCKLVAEAHERVVRDSGGDKDYADAIALYLGEAVSKLTCFHNMLAYWRSKETKCASGMGRQAIPMTWDYAETNPFGAAAGDFGEVAVKAAPKVVAQLPACGEGRAFQHDAITRLELKVPVLVSTDPPYYDNISYADLSDYFYVWLRRSIGPFCQSLFSTLLTPKADELIASAYRHNGSGDEAKAFFEDRLGQVFRRIYEIQDARFPVTVYYAFKQAEEEGEEGLDDLNATKTGTVASTGWETMLDGLISAGWQIDGTWPLRTENRTRILATGNGGTNTLASSIVLVCRPRPNDAGVASRRDFLAALKKELPEALRNLQKGNIAPVDLAQAAIGPGMAVFSRYAKVVESDGSPMDVRAALAEINRSLDEVLAEQEGEFDSDTRWALAWFEQDGFNEGAYGTAETLSTAKNTSVKGLEDAGILASRAGKVRLLRRDELVEGWDPATDARFTVWEATHYLCRVLETGGVDKAARLAARLGSARAETARDLAYRLYSVCERRKWAQDAIAYNNLVIAWPEIKQATDKLAETTPAQSDLNL